MAKISVVIPVYNSEKYLEKCLDSLLNQTLNDIEIVLVNDGSRDNSQQIIDRYREKYPDIIKSYTQENSGQASARNRGLEYAGGEFISFIDSDDYMELDAYERAYTKAKETDSDIVCFGFYEIKNGKKEQRNYTFLYEDENDVRYVLNEASPWNKLIKRSLIEENSIRFNENRIYEDLELIPQLALYTDKICFMEDRLYNYVIHEDSTMRQKVYNPKLASIYIVMETLKEKFSDTKYKDELEYLYIEHFLHGAVLRYLEYTEGDGDIIKIADIMKAEFPKWRKNKYYKRMGWKYKVMCNLAYGKNIKLLRRIFGGR